MTDKAVLLSNDDGIATITLNRPSALNSINKLLADELIECLNLVKNDNSVKTIILTGSGKAFCAGGDLSYIENLKDIIEARSFIAQVGQFVSIIMEMDKPVIAMVNGVAAGAGFNLALACDIIFCADSARFAQSFAKVGLIPDCGGMYLLPRIVGLHKAKELMFTADLIDAKTAHSLKLVNRVCANESLEEETKAFAKKIADSAPIAVGLIKKTLNRYDTMTLNSLLEHEADMQAYCLQTQDHKEGVSAFKEKRMPSFKGI
ncbi:enoyl-CoA hydratase/isomerase family protein [Dendrosporobacter sp. 1207_IL3150]|uniref:enoyl-CoA hydratase/isomerase family protein n=1 Tax=Dendrosporobacter sp. 1207_IL3150 TaxID=3084054 RepID=UPI002FD98432